MYVDLDNINFYNNPPPPKPPAHALPSSRWKSYHVPPAPQSLSLSLSHPLPPKPPIAVTAAIPTSTVNGHFQCTATSHNIFDIELENVSTRENSPVMRETDPEADHQSGSHDGNDLGARCRHTTPTPVPSSMTSKPPAIPGDTDYREGGEGGDHLDTCTQSPGDALCSSGLMATSAEADSDYSGGRPVSAVDNLLSDSDSLQLSLSGCEVEKQTMTKDGVPKHHNSQLPSPALSGLASPPENKCRARPGQHHGITFEDLPSEAACCGERARALTVSASNTPTATPSIASSRDASAEHEDNSISILPSPSWQPQRNEKQVRSTLSPSRVLRPRVNTESNRPDRPPSIAVVIPIRQSARSMARTSRSSLVQPSRRPHQASASYAIEEDRPTDAFTEGHSLLTREAAADGEERPQKRRRRNQRSKETARNTSVCAGGHDHDAGCIGASQPPSKGGFHTSSGEAQEIFGRGIIRIQPHGPRHAYFFTFLPDAVDHPLSRSPSALDSDEPSCTGRATYTSSKACAVEKGNVQLGRRQTQTQKANPKAWNNRNRGTHQKNSRKGKPWLPEEEELLLKLKNDQGLPWSVVVRLFSEQYPGRSQGSIQVYWSTNIKKRLP